MATTNTKTLITVKTDKTLKKAVQEFAEEIGISMGTLVNSFFRQIVRDRKINFSVSETPNSYLRSVIVEAEKEYSEGKLQGFNSVGELMKELRS